MKIKFITLALVTATANLFGDDLLLIDAKCRETN